SSSRLRASILSADSHQFAQAAQAARRFRAGIDLRPGGIRHLSHIQIAAGIDREAMRGDELIEFLACSNIADAANQFSLVVHDADAWPEIGDLAVDRHGRSEFPDV